MIKKKFTAGDYETHDIEKFHYSKKNRKKYRWRVYCYKHDKVFITHGKADPKQCPFCKWKFKKYKKRRSK